MGVATVGVLYAAVRRWFNPAAGLLAGLVMALTPAAALMFRFNNPDALLNSAHDDRGVYGPPRDRRPRARWFVLTGVAIGFGFLTKQLQVLLVVPALGGAYLLFGKPRFVRRLADLALAFVSMIVAAGWWVAIVELWPASSRPYIGGSQTNSIVELTLGYNGLRRPTGQETGSVGGGGPVGLAGNGGIWGPTGITRMFANEIGGQIAWLIPAALAMLLVGLWITRRAPRQILDARSLILWGGWLIVTGLTFSFMSGIFHAEYTVALAPPIAALVGIGATMLWARRTHWASLLVMAGVVLDWLVGRLIIGASTDVATVARRLGACGDRDRHCGTRHRSCGAARVAVDNSRSCRGWTSGRRGHRRVGCADRMDARNRVRIEARRNRHCRPSRRR